MSRFYVPKEAVKGDDILISGKEAHHILDVMRLKLSDKVVVFDGTGKEYACVVRETRSKSLSLEIIKTRHAAAEESYSTALIQAIPKKDKMDYIVQKATELGVKNIFPATTARTIPEWDGSKKSNIVERWRKIALEAAKQCGRADIPGILPITELKKAISAAVNAAENDDNASAVYMMAALSDKAVKLKDVLKDHHGSRITIAIGPEGDFTPEELKAAEEEGFKIVSLGKRVLKSDTAGLAVLSAINYEYQD